MIRPPHSRRGRLAAACAIVALAGAKGIALSLFVPPFHGPDEQWHFDHVQALAENGTLPPPQPICTGPILSPEVRSAVRQLVEGVAFHPLVPVPRPGGLVLPSGTGSRSTSGCGPASIYPPVWYASAAVAYRAAERRPLLQRLLAVRWTSVAWSAAGALAALVLGAVAFGNVSDALLYALVVVLQPMTGALGAVANSEAAAVACATGALAAIACAWRNVAPRRALAAAGLLLAVGALTKPSLVLALPMFGALLLGALHGGWRRRVAVTAAVLVIPVAAALAFALSGGSRAGLYDEIASTGTLPQQIARHLLSARRLFDVWVKQYWGKLGWMDAPAAQGWYLALAVATALALAGVLWAPRHRARERAILAIVGGTSAAYALALYAVAWRRGDLLWVQGRHVLVLFPAHAYLLVRGLAALRRRLPRAVDPAALLPVLLLLVNAALVLAAAHRFYGASPVAPLAEWQTAWGIGWMVQAAAVACALAVGLISWAVWARRAPTRNSRLVGRAV